MPFKNLFQEYPCKNMELRAYALTAYEFGLNTAKESSGGLSMGLDEHALTRQKQMIEVMTGQINALKDRPVPDLPHIYPEQFPIDLSEEYPQTTVDGEPLNQDTQLLCQTWMGIGISLAKSQSAGKAGGMEEADYKRAMNQIATIAQYVAEIEGRPGVDLPHTAEPGAVLEVPSDMEAKEPG